MIKTTSMAWGAPGRYIQGPGEIKRLALYTEKYGKKVFAIIDEYFFNSFSEIIGKIYSDFGGEFMSFEYHTEITKKLIDEAIKKAENFCPNAIIGIGGGKAIDTAKSVAGALSLPLIIIPTSASTDAPTSAMAVIYNDKHEHDDVYYFIKNPDLVLVDSEIIANSPVRFLIAGMGDALATVFEGRTSIHTNSGNYICNEIDVFRNTRTAKAIAEECYRALLENGKLAKMANELHTVTEALEAVIEANTLMSGIGFENVGCAASHCICNGITAAPNGAEALHGEKVAFGVICQLIAENAPMSLIDEVIRFNISVGLPVCLKDMNIEETEENFEIIAQEPQNTEWTREPFPVTKKMVIDIIKNANALGKSYKNI